MRQTVIGLFNKSSDAQQAVQRLLSNGFTNDNVDISLSTTSGATAGTMSGTSGSTTSSTSGSTNFNLDNDDHDEHESGISRFFKNLFGDDDNDNANRYSTASRGKSLVTVHAMSEEEARRASDILDDAGATDVDDDASDSNYGTYGTTGATGATGAAPVGAFNETTGLAAGMTTGTTTGTTLGSTSGMTPGSTLGTTGTTGIGDSDFTNTTNSDVTDKTIPIIEENLAVGKRTVETGGVRLRSRIVERPVEEELRLRQERVYVQRNPVNRVASEADFTTFREGDVEVTEHAEVPVVSKEARVVEEVSLGKDVDERTETIRDTVRKTEVDVDNLEDKSSSDTTWRNNS